jgi:hypothetical protein
VAPLLLLFWSQGPGNIDFLEPPNLGAFVGLFGELTGYGGPSLTALYFLTCCAAFMGVRRLRSSDLPGLWIGWMVRGRDVQGFSYLLIWLFVPILMTFAISTFLLPIYQARYLVIVAPPLACIAAIGLLRLPASFFIVIMTGLITLSTRGLDLLYGGHLYSEDWRGASRHVLMRTDPTDGIVFEAPWVRIPFEYYAELRRFRPSMPHPIFPSAEWGELSIITSQFEVTAKQWLRRRPVETHRVWVVLAHQFAYGFRKHLLPLSFEKRYELISQQTFTSITVSLYQRRSM